MRIGRHRHAGVSGRRLLLLCAGWLAAGLGAAAPASAQSSLPKIDKSVADRQMIRDNVVGIVTGNADGIYAEMGQDLGRLLDDRARQSLRVTVQLGLGSVGNLDDLRNLPGVSLAIVQGDVLEAYAADRAQQANLQQNIRYVSRLHTEILHVVTRKDVIKDAGKTICALRGRAINVGGLRSGTAITVRKVFNEMLGLNVSLDPASANEAFDQLAARKVDAVAYMVGRSAKFFSRLDLAKRFNSNVDSFEWLTAPAALLETDCAGQPIPRESNVYEPTTLSNADYPSLISPGTTVESIGAPAVLAAYRFDDPSSARSRATERFIERFFAQAASADGLGRAGRGYNINWCGVDLAAPPRSWQRHDAAAKALGQQGASRKIVCAPLPAFCASDQSKKAEFDSRRRQAGQPVVDGLPYSRDLVAFDKAHCQAAQASPNGN